MRGEMRRGVTIRPTRMAIGLVGALVAVAVGACGGPDAASARAPLGEPSPGLSDAERGRFLLGRALFERLATADEGLGPLYNADRCSACHDEPTVGGGGVAVPVVKATRWSDGTCDPLLDRGGDNLQTRVTDLFAAHGGAAEEVPPEATASRSVVAPPLFGLGLLEAIPDSVLALRADPGDRDGDGVSGRVPVGPDGRLARFGRKGDAVDIEGFVDTALRFELGLTTPLHPVEERRHGEPLPAAADPAPDPEIDARGLSLLADYVRLLAPPAPEDATGATADSIRDGEAVFGRLGCTACHTPHPALGPDEEPAPDDVPVYSDLLLHDLGYGADDVCTAAAAPGEYRTAPLWGLRHRSRLLHDGQASDPAAAIGFHGGEAERARAAFFALPPEDRARLLRFLGSL